MTHSLLRKPLLWAPVAALALTTMSAFAAPVVGPSGAAFYTPPSPLPSGSHGDLIWYRTTTFAPPGAPAVKAWTVLYQSTDALGATNAVTGTVLVPTAAWAGSGTRPVIGYEVGTHGLAQSCAPSLQMAAGTDYENANISAALNGGYAVLVTDNPGYTTGATPTYLAGVAQGNAALDLFKAATQIPSVGIVSTTKAAIWGYSQGGQTAAWAGQLQATYAPSVKLVGVAAGGVPADFINTSKYLNGSTGASFLLEGVIGLATQYPNSIPLATLTNAAGQAAIVKGKSECVFQSLFDFINVDISQYTVNNETLAQLEAIPSVNQVLLAQNLGGTKIPVPLYQYHGLADEFIPLDQAETLKQTYCSMSVATTFVTYPSEHIATQFQAAPYVLSWLGDRFNGKTATSTCSTTTARPVSTANPGGGNFVVSLNEWPLAATLTLAKLGQDVVLPDTSTFSAETDLTADKLTGSLAVPDFKTKLKVVGIPLTVKLSVTNADPATGTVSLDNAGLLHIHGDAFANLEIDSLGISVIQLPFGCSTGSAIDFPIDFDGPVSSLGNGNLNFPGTTSFPKFSTKGCLLSALFNVLISGPGQTYSFTVTPPAPVNW